MPPNLVLLSRLRIAERPTRPRAAKGAANNNHGQGPEGFLLVLVQLETTEDHHQAYVQLAEEQGSQEYSKSVGHPAPGAELPEYREGQALGRAEGKATLEGETEDHQDTLVLEARRGALGRNRKGGRPLLSREGGNRAQGGGGGQRQSGERDRGLRWEVEHSYVATEGG